MRVHIRAWTPPRGWVELTAGPVRVSREEHKEPVEHRYVGFRDSNSHETEPPVEPLLWEGED